ncbi:MAG: BatA domain-containing protein [Gemmatimonadota bacterium]
MPVLASPSYLFAALGAAAVVVALHLLAWRRPTPTPFPTARFAPPSAVRAVSRALRPSDLLLLLARVVALLLAGLALARPTFSPAPAGTARVLLIDASRRVASMDAVRDSARAHATGADAVAWVRVDSVARSLADSVTGERADARGNLTAGLVAALRQAQRLAQTYAHVDLVVISPFAAESWDAATERVRREWRGDVTAVRVASRPDSDAVPRTHAATRVGEHALPPVDDPVGAAFTVAVDGASPALRVRRDAPSAEDSVWARGGGVLVWWPRPSQANSDTGTVGVSILTDGRESVAGHFRALSDRPITGAAILRWSDGTVAATEVPLSAGCLRTIAVEVPSSGDEVLRPAFTRLVRALAAPCGGGSSAAVDDATLARWATGDVRTPGRADSSAASDVATAAGASSPEASRIRDEPALPDSLTRWLLIAATLVLLLEWWMRRARGARATRDSVAQTDRREAA